MMKTSYTLIKESFKEIKNYFTKNSKGLDFIVCRVEGNLIKEQEDDKTVLCRIEGKDIKKGLNGKTMIKMSDAARAIGSKSENPLVAAMWYLFCRE